MRKGVQLKNNLTKSCKVKKINNYSFNIILTQGMNRQIRKMCLKLDYKVKFLRRMRIINIKIGSLKLGRFRNFTNEELQKAFSEIFHSGFLDKLSKAEYLSKPEDIIEE